MIDYATTSRRAWLRSTDPELLAYRISHAAAWVFVGLSLYAAFQ